jgi:hypothetical protein
MARFTPGGFGAIVNDLNGHPENPITDTRGPQFRHKSALCTNVDTRSSTSDWGPLRRAFSANPCPTTAPHSNGIPFALILSGFGASKRKSALNGSSLGRKNDKSRSYIIFGSSPSRVRSCIYLSANSSSPRASGSYENMATISQYLPSIANMED